MGQIGQPLTVTAQLDQYVTPLKNEIRLKEAEDGSVNPLCKISEKFVRTTGCKTITH